MYSANAFWILCFNSAKSGLTTILLRRFASFRVFDIHTCTDDVVCMMLGPTHCFHAFPAYFNVSDCIVVDGAFFGDHCRHRVLTLFFLSFSMLSPYPCRHHLKFFHSRHTYLLRLDELYL